MKEPATPNEEIICSYLKEWDNLDNYILQENSLNLLFNKLCNSNKSIENILLKVSALNDFYSTNIYDTFTVAKHILKCDIDNELENHNKELVNKIALIKMKRKTINFYSFASKYCSHHKPEHYPIYDVYVEKMLMFFKKRDKFDSFKKEDIKNYPRFIEIINNFKVNYNLQQYSLRQIDIYLWLAGKEHFPKTYKKPNRVAGGF